MARSHILLELDESIPTLHELRAFLAGDAYHITETEFNIAAESMSMEHCLQTWRLLRRRHVAGLIEMVHGYRKVSRVTCPEYAALKHFQIELVDALDDESNLRSAFAFVRPDVEFSSDEVETAKRRAKFTVRRAAGETSAHLNFLRDIPPPARYPMAIPKSTTGKNLYLHPYRFRTLQVGGILRGHLIEKGLLPSEIFADGFFFTGYRSLVTPNGLDVGDMAAMVAASKAATTGLDKRRWNARKAIYTAAASLAMADRMNRAGDADIGRITAAAKVDSLLKFLRSGAGANITCLGNLYD